MTRTKPLILVLLAVLGGGIAWFVETVMVASGQAVIVPPLTLGLALLLIGVIIVIMALPVRRVTRGEQKAHIDPFYATRVVVLAKASSLSGAILAGAGLGIIGFLITRSVVPLGSVTVALTTAIGAIILLVAGLVAESMCAIPPADDEKPGNKPQSQGTL